MPFGKHKGQTVESLPDDYLAWLLTRDLYEPLTSAVLGEAERRGEEAARRESSGMPPKEILNELLTAGFHSLAKRYHPDTGGDEKIMQHVTAAVTWLRKHIKETYK